MVEGINEKLSFRSEGINTIGHLRFFDYCLSKNTQSLCLRRRNCGCTPFQTRNYRRYAIPAPVLQGDNKELGHRTPPNWFLSLLPRCW